MQSAGGGGVAFAAAAAAAARAAGRGLRRAQCTAAPPMAARGGDALGAVKRRRNVPRATANDAAGPGDRRRTGRARRASPKLELDELVVGSVYDGEVTRVEKFGCFVDIGCAVWGLVHVSQVANEFVNDINLYVAVGDRVKVHLLSVDADRRRISLSMRLVQDPPTATASKYARIYELGGDWGDAWNRDGDTKWADFGDDIPMPEDQLLMSAVCSAVR